MKRFWRRAVTLTVAVALLGGVAPQAAQAGVRSAHQAATAVVTASSPVALAEAPAPAAPASAPVTVTGNAPAPADDITTQRSWRKLKTIFGGLWDAAVAAARAGWAVWQRFWDRVPTAVKIALRVIGGSWDVYKIVCSVAVVC